MKRALICGVSGQDGAYLAELLLTKGYEVFGTSRDAQLASFSNLVHLGVRDRMQTDFQPTNARHFVHVVRMQLRRPRRIGSSRIIASRTSASRVPGSSSTTNLLFGASASWVRSTEFHFPAESQVARPP
jgi:hypothetical protein